MLNGALDERSDLNTGARLMLSVLGRVEPTRSTDLAILLGLSRAAVSRRAAALAAGGLVEADGDPADGRASLLRLTELGHENRRRALTVGVSVAKELTRGFTEAEVLQLSALLTRLNDNASEIDDAQKGSPPAG